MSKNVFDGSHISEHNNMTSAARQRYGDKQSLNLELLYKKYFAGLVKFLKHRYGISHDLAEDVAHETYVSLQKYLLADKVLDQEKALIYRIAKNKLVDFHRRNGSLYLESECEDGLDQVSDSPMQEDILFAQEQLDQLEQAVLGLPPRCQEVFVLRVFEHMSYKQIALHFDISVSMVEKHLQKAFKLVREGVER